MTISMDNYTNVLTCDNIVNKVILKEIKMAIQDLNIEGLRSFEKETIIMFAMPNGNDVGSGLNVFVGGNNSGKSTIIEALHLLSYRGEIMTLPNNLLNDKNHGHLKIEVNYKNNEDKLVNLKFETSEDTGTMPKINGKFIGNDYEHERMKNVMILSSKRSIASTFSNLRSEERNEYESNVFNLDYRNQYFANSSFGGRLIKIINDRATFNSILKRVIDPIPNWSLGADEFNKATLTFRFGNHIHNSTGSGDGYINLFNIVDALYDSKNGDTIVIDEPEVSLHPELLRRLFSLLVEYSKDRQIIIATHSPYFVDWKLFSENSKVMRVSKENYCSHIYELSDDGKGALRKFLNDQGNIHTISLDTNEVFFLGDNIIVTEGQEDVIGYKKMFADRGFYPNASFFGWGAGGALKIEQVLKILADLGYRKVFAIYDGDMKDVAEKVEKKFPNYKIYTIRANDIRNKDVNSSVEKIRELISKSDSISEESKKHFLEIIDDNFKIKEGIFKDKGFCNINEKYKSDIDNLINEIKKYFEIK